MELIERIIPKFKNSKAVVATKSKLKKVGYDGEKITLIEWGMLALIAYFCFLSFHFVDMDSILDNTVLFVRSIFDGKFFDFYEYSMENAATSWSANYELPVYVLFSIWNAPTIVLSMLKDINYLENFYCILWSKLLIVVFNALVAFMVYKILRLAGLNKNRSVFGAFLFSSSTLLMMFTMVIVQMDIIPVFFMLLGIYYYLKNDNLKFVIAFAVAIPLKAFALFIFVPMIVLKFKKVIDILLFFIGGMSLQLICKLIFIASPEYNYATSSNTNNIINSLVKGNVDVANAALPGYFAAFITICIVCYIVKAASEKDLLRYVAYISFAVFSTLFLFFSTNTYWIVLTVPFMILVIMLNPKNLKLNLFLEMAISGSYVLYCFCYSTTFTLIKGTFDSMMLNRLFPVREGYERQFAYVKKLFSYLDILKFQNVFFAVFFVCVVVFLIINFPKRPSKTVLVIGNNEKIEYSVIWVRFLITIVSIAIVVFSYIKTIQNPIVNTTTYGQSKTSISVSDERNMLAQSFTVKQDSTVEMIRIKFDNENDNRKNMGNVIVKLKNSKGDILYNKKIGTSMIRDDKDFDLKLGKTKLYANEKYTLEFTGTKHNNSKKTKLYVTKELSDDIEPMIVNGEPMMYNLYMKIQ